MKKRGLLLSLLSMIMLVSCSVQDKTVILSDDTSKDEELRYSVTSKTIKTDKGEYFIPGYYYEDEIYGTLGKASLYGEYHDRSIAYYDTKSDNYNKLDDTKLDSVKSSVYKKYITYEEDDKGEYQEISVVDYITKEETQVDIFRSKKDEKYNTRYERLDFVSGSDNYIYFGVVSINDSTGEVCNELTIYDIEKNQNYYMNLTSGTEGFIDIKDIEYSKTLDKFFGFNHNGEVCELRTELGTIVPKVIYKFDLESNEGISYNGYFTGTMITGENIVITITRADSDSNRYDRFKVLNLRTLKEEELNEKLNIDGNVAGDSTILTAFSFSLGYSMVQLSLDSNEYIIIDSSGEEVELIKKITVQEDFYISNAICSEDGKKILISILNSRNNDIKQELIEFNIEKLY